VSATVDVNILVYATNSTDPAHAQALSLVERLAAGPDLVYVFWPVAMSYLRIVTHAAILPHPISPADAIGNLDNLLARDHVRAPGEGAGFWDIFRRTSGSVRGNQVPDAHLASLMRQHGVGVVYSSDRDLRRFEGIRVEDPFV
jgi:toxin-antitoxin system PIN domain toxin